MKKIVIFDLEATCYDGNRKDEIKPEGFDNEIIEIGAVMLDETGKEISRYSSFAKPKLFPKIPYLCILNIYYMRNIWKMNWKNDGFRSLYESAIYPEVIEAIEDWKQQVSNCVLVGGLALSYYIKPRQTQDVDVIFLTDKDIPNTVYGFRRNRNHSFEHIKTGVEVEVLTPEFLNKNKQLFQKTFDDSILSNGIRVASPKSLIVLKLNRFNERDKVDILELITHCKLKGINLDMSDYELNNNELKNLNSLDIDDSIDENMYVLETKSYFRDKKEFIKISEGLNGNNIYIFENEFGEPRFHYSKNMENKIRKVNDFQFSLSLKSLDVLESSTGYKSFFGFEKDEEVLKNWLENNKEYLINKWKEINN